MPATSITEFGAIGDGITLNTAVLQRAIDAVTAEGGSGHLIVPRGRYVTGTLYLRSGLQLELQPGAVIQASGDIDDYDFLDVTGHKDLQPYHFLVLKNLHDVTIFGAGTIDGSGPSFWEKTPNARGWYRELDKRPSPMLECVGCSNLCLRGITIANSPGWTLHLKCCDDVLVDGIKIRNNLFGPNTDGIDVNGCRDVRVANCLIEAGDDAIVLKTTKDARSCERVVVTNCIIDTNCRALKLGAHESYLDMRDVAFSNCVVLQSVAVFALYCRNGGTLENIVVSNVVGHAFSNADYNQPIHIDLGRRNEEDTLGRIRNVSINNMVLHSNGRVLVTGDPEQYVENITLDTIQLHLRDWFDPWPHGLTAGGNQFSPSAPEARAARAAVAVQYAHNFSATNIRVFKTDPLPGDFVEIWRKDCSGVE